MEGLSQCGRAVLCPPAAHQVLGKLHRDFGVERMINERMELFRPTLDREKQLKKILLIRCDNTLPAVAGRIRSELMQLGLLYSPHGAKESAREFGDELLAAAVTSSFGTLTLLYEKERYFQKALRQAVQGSIIKYGDWRDIQGQTAILEKTARAQKYCVPEVLPPADLAPQRPFSWYRMTRLTPSSLMDLLTTTKGFQDYEVTALVRSCFSHLRETFWSPLSSVTVRSRSWLSLPFAFALDRIEETCKNITNDKKLILDGRPIKSKRDIDMFDHKDVKPYLTLLETLANPANTFTVEWKDRPGPRSEYKNAKGVLLEVKESLRNIPGRGMRTCLGL